MRARSGLVAVALSLSVVMLGGCRDDDDGFTAGTQNSPPTISGTPKTAVHAGGALQVHSSRNRPGRTGAAVQGQESTGLVQLRCGHRQPLPVRPPRMTSARFADVTISVSDGNHANRCRRSRSSRTPAPASGPAGADDAIRWWPVPVRGYSRDRVRTRLPRIGAARDLPHRHAEPLETRRPRQPERLETAYRDRARVRHGVARRRALRRRDWIC